MGYILQLHKKNMEFKKCNKVTNFSKPNIDDNL